MNLNAAACLFIVVNFQKPMIKSIIQKKDRHLGGRLKVAFLPTRKYMKKFGIFPFQILAIFLGMVFMGNRYFSRYPTTERGIL